MLTDFEEMRVLDCRYKPDISTALGHAVLKYHYPDYADKETFRTIYYLFSHEAVLNGSIESFAKGMPKLSRKRAQRGVGTDAHQSIDESFLQELDDFREELARAYKRKNPELDSAELTEVTQRTLDRLVFMRFLEDKLIEDEPLIEDLHKRGKSWANFIATSRRLDPLRTLISKNKHLEQVVHFRHEQVFSGASTYTCLMFLDRKPRDYFEFIPVADIKAWRESSVKETLKIPGNQVTADEWNFAGGTAKPLFDRLRTREASLGSMAHLFVGLQTDADDVFILEEIRKVNECYANRSLQDESIGSKAHT